MKRIYIINLSFLFNLNILFVVFELILREKREIKLIK